MSDGLIFRLAVQERHFKEPPFEQRLALSAPYHGSSQNTFGKNETRLLPNWLLWPWKRRKDSSQKSWTGVNSLKQYDGGLGTGQRDGKLLTFYLYNLSSLLASRSSEHARKQEQSQPSVILKWNRDRSNVWKIQPEIVHLNSKPNQTTKWLSKSGRATSQLIVISPFMTNWQ